MLIPMANQEQIQAILAMMQQQMDRLDAMQQENKELSRQNSKQGESKLKRPDRPVIEGNLNDSEWSLFLGTWPGLHAAIFGDYRFLVKIEFSHMYRKIPNISPPEYKPPRI